MPWEHGGALGSGPVAGPVVSSCGFSSPEGGCGVWRFQRDHIERASHEPQIDASAFNPHTYHCCTKDKLSLKTKPAVKGQAHGLYTQPFISGSLALLSSVLPFPSPLGA